jgi:hypothetical protein
MSREQFENLDIDQEQKAYEESNLKNWEEHYKENPFDAEVMKTTSIPVIKDHLNYLLWSVESGNSNPLEVFAVVKTIEKMFSDLKSKIDGYALDEAERFGKSSFEDFGCKFELRNGGKMFDYKHIPEWSEAKKNLENVEAKYKLAFENNEKNIMSVSNDGEVLELPKVSFRKSSLIVKIK